MAAIHPYLIFKGNCEEAFRFYKSVFGGEFGYLGRFSEMPPDASGELRADEGDKIMYISLPIGKNTILMGSDSRKAPGDTNYTGNFSISLNTETREEADKLFDRLSADGKVEMPMGNTFWHAYFGMVTDKFGVQWRVSFAPAG